MLSKLYSISTEMYIKKKQKQKNMLIYKIIVGKPLKTVTNCP